MKDRLARKLQCYTHLSDADWMRLTGALDAVRHVAVRADIIDQGDGPHAVNVVLDGWACRYRLFPDGRRQIIALLLPGDPCDSHVFLLNRMDHAIGALTPVVLGQISGQVMQELTERSPTLDYAFHRERLATAAIQREWTVSLGRRSAIERLAHLFCELNARLTAVGLADESGFAMPLTQADLGDMLGQTSVHINRTLQELRRAGLISLRSRYLTIQDMDALTELAQFDPIYLHFTENGDRS